MRFLFLLWYCLVKHLDNIIQFLQKISFIWWDKFICNSKYIFINETGFIKEKIVIVVGKSTRSIVLQSGARLCRAPRGGDGVGKFSPSCGAGRGGDGTRQYHTGRGRRPHPSAPPRPLAIPKRVEFEVKTQGRDIFWLKFESYLLDKITYQNALFYENSL